MSIIKIEPFSENHLIGVYNIEVECFTSPWSIYAFIDVLENPDAHYYTAVDEQDGIAGFIGMCRSGDDCEIHNLAVSGQFRRKGIASLLLGTLLSCCKSSGLVNVYLEVRESNKGAIELYQKHGFTKIGIRKKYYDSPKEDALIMQLSLSNSIS